MAVRKPKPYVKPSISVTKPADRVWQTIPAVRLSEGDIVPDLGQVVKISHSLVTTHVTFFSGRVEYYSDSDKLWCFSLRERDGVSQ